MIRENGTVAAYYGHASVGCIHVRPFINLKQQADVDRMYNISREASDLVMEMGGAMSGEHGDGLVRSMWNEKVFGSRLYNAFRDVKRAFDPTGIMNPGKIVDSQRIVENLRYGPAYTSLTPTTKLSFAAEGGFNARWRCVTEWGSVAEPSTARCVHRTWLPVRRSTPPGAAPTPSGRPSPACSPRMSSPAIGCTRCWTCAWSARRARRSAPPKWIWQR